MRHPTRILYSLPRESPNRLVRRASVVLATLVALVQPASAQLLFFEVASIKPNTSGTPPQSRFPLGTGDAYAPGGLFIAVNQPLVAYLRFAYKVSDFDGLPSWIYNERFDIQARAPGMPTKDEMRLMMRSLLAERFKLAMHVEARQETVLNLVLATAGRSGQYLRPAAPCTDGTSVLDLPPIACGNMGPVAATAPGRARLVGRGVTMARLASFITNPVTGIDRPVIDRTGLNGTFDFTIEWSPAPDSAQPQVTSQDDGPTFLQALRDQLGLSLTRARGSVDAIVIDRIEHPTPD